MSSQIIGQANDKLNFNLKILKSVRNVHFLESMAWLRMSQIDVTFILFLLEIKQSVKTLLLAGGKLVYY